MDVIPRDASPWVRRHLQVLSTTFAIVAIAMSLECVEYSKVVVLTDTLWPMLFALFSIELWLLSMTVY